MTTDEEGIDHFHGHPAKGEELTREILKRLKFDNDTIYHVAAIVKHHDMELGSTQRTVRRAVFRAGEDIYPLLFEVKRADMEAQSLYRREEKEASLKLSRRLYEQVKERRDCLSLGQLAVGGRELIALGLKPGPGLAGSFRFCWRMYWRSRSTTQRNI